MTEPSQSGASDPSWSTPPTPPTEVTPPADATPPPAADVPPPVPPPTQWAAPPPAWPPSQSGDGPAPGYLYVGFWRRFLATMIDGVLLSFLFSIILAIFLSRIDSGTWRVFTDVDPDTLRPLASNAELVRAFREVAVQFVGLVGVLWLCHFLYHVILWTWRGGTLGQVALGIEVRRESDGRRIGLGTAILRYVGYLVSTWVLYLGLIWVAFDRRKQGWHDKIAGTLVIRRAD